jgi:hypothetical protein
LLLKLFIHKYSNEYILQINHTARLGQGWLCKSHLCSNTASF